MELYYQEKENDCMTATLATLLQIPPKDIPFFFEMEDPNKSYNEWLLHRFGLCVIAVDYDKKMPKLPGLNINEYYCLGTLKKDSREFSHAVILHCEKELDGIRTTIYHDPLGEKTDYDISDLVGIEYLVYICDSLNCSIEKEKNKNDPFSINKLYDVKYL